MIIVRIMIRKFDLADLAELKAAIESLLESYEGVEIDISIPPERPTV
jgi:hypothetical protein